MYFIKRMKNTKVGAHFCIFKTYLERHYIYRTFIRRFHIQILKILIKIKVFYHTKLKSMKHLWQTVRKHMLLNWFFLLNRYMNDWLVDYNCILSMLILCTFVWKCFRLKWCFLLICWSRWIDSSSALATCVAFNVCGIPLLSVVCSAHLRSSQPISALADWTIQLGYIKRNDSRINRSSSIASLLGKYLRQLTYIAEYKPH